MDDRLKALLVNHEGKDDTWTWEFHDSKGKVAEGNTMGDVGTTMVDLQRFIEMFRGTDPLRPQIVEDFI